MHMNEMINQNQEYAAKQAEKVQIAAQMLGSLLLFTRIMYKNRTGREYNIINPVSREPRQITICKALTDVFHLRARWTNISTPPGSGKSEALIAWVAWCLAQYPDSNILYVAHTSSLAAQHTSTIRDIINLPLYKDLFSVSLRSDAQAKSDFTTNFGGQVAAFGAAGAITGRNAGLPGLDRFSGALIYDDPHKASEVFSDVKRNAVIQGYSLNVRTRLRGINVPVINIGQRTHEDDLSGYFISGQEGHSWSNITLSALDAHDNNLIPDVMSTEDLQLMRTTSRYEYASQYNQQPTSAGNTLYREDDFKILPTLPKILSTFIVVDTAETDKNWNDATVFLFVGVYNVTVGDIETGEQAIHVLDCMETRIEPRELQNAFETFYTNCMRFPVKPKRAAIEKKSTGTYLISLLKNIQGISILEIERNANSGSKANRFVDAQAYIAQGLVTFTEGDKHVRPVIEHMTKITANDSHRFDDIADCIVDAIRLALVEKNGMIIASKDDLSHDMLAQKLHDNFALRTNRYVNRADPYRRTR